MTHEMAPKKWMSRLWPITWTSAFHVGILCAGALLCLASPLHAQTVNEEYWVKLREADTRVRSSRAIWKHVNTHQPEPWFDVEKFVAKAVENEQRKGADEERVREMERAYRQTARELKLGTQQTRFFNFVHQSTALRCEIKSGLPVRIGAPPGPLSSYHLDYWNGETTVDLMREAPLGNKPLNQLSVVGYVRRNVEEVMPHVGRGNLPFLVGTPLLTGFAPQGFSPDNSFLRDGPNNTLTLESSVQKPRPLLTRITFSKQTWCPTRIEIAALPNKKVFRRFSFTDYKLYPGGVWFAGRVFIERGVRSDGQPAFSNENYQLLSAAFNEAADVSELKTPLPIGAKIADQRFAPRSTAGYTIKDGTLPSDAEVLKLVEQREAYEAEMARQARQQTLKTLALPAGLLLMAIGVLMLRRQNRAAATQPKTAGTTPKKV